MCCPHLQVLGSYGEVPREEDGCDSFDGLSFQDHGRRVRRRRNALGPNLESSCGPIFSQFPTDAISSRWRVWELTEETIHLSLGCLHGGERKGVSESQRVYLGTPIWWA